MKKLVIANFIFPLIFYISSNAQFSTNLDLESGYYQSRNEFSKTNNRWGANAHGKLKYAYKNKSTSASAVLNARPELHGLNDDSFSLKLKASGNYLYRGEDLDWQLNFSAQSFNIDITRNNYINRSILLSTGLSTKLFNTTPVNFRAGYSTRSISLDRKLTLDLLFADALIFEDFASLQFGYGIYIEKFDIDNSMLSLSNAPAKINNGLRVGPTISMNYVKDFFFKVKYEFLLHNSEITESLSFEHQIYLVLGKLLSKRVSAFFFLNFYINKLKFDKNFEVYSLPYIPANIDNVVFAKLAYDLNNKIEIYLKSGYRKIELFQNGSDLNGWNLLIGFSISK